MRLLRTVLTCAINAGLRVTGVMPTCILGNAYSATIFAFGGSGTGFKFTPDPAETLPSGLTFTDNSDGTATVAGTTSVPGNVHVFGTLRDSLRNTITYSFIFNVQPLPLSLTGSFAGGVTATAASGGLTASGGVAPYTYALASGPCAINTSTGAATGNWFAAGTYNWTGSVTDSLGSTATVSDTTVVSAPSNNRITDAGDTRITDASDIRIQD